MSSGIRSETAGVQRMWVRIERGRRQAPAASSGGTAAAGTGGGGISIASARVRALWRKDASKAASRGFPAVLWGTASGINRAVE